MNRPLRLRVEGLTKSFNRVRVLQNVGFEAAAAEVVGVVGENGSGKSTTMNILAGVLQQDEGYVWLDGEPHTPRNRREADQAGIAFVQQELSLFPNLNVAENLFLGRLPRRFSRLPLTSHRQMYERARQVLRDVDLDVNPRTVTSKLSAGERQLLEIGRGLSTDARVMIFDEPTTSLTQREIDRLFQIIRRLQLRGVTILYVSHDLDHVIRLSDHVVVMRDGRVVLRDMADAITAHDLVVAMVGRSIGTLFPTRPAPQDRAEAVLEVDAVSEPGVVSDVTFRIGRGEIVGLAGLMGAGRTELARILFGLDPHRQGNVTLEGRKVRPGDLAARFRAGIAFLTEDRRHEGLMMDATVMENMSLAALPLFARRSGGRLREQALSQAVRALAARLQIKFDHLARKAVRTLSGGNQQKVIIARWLLRTPVLFILDEPTRGIDVGAKEEIYRLLVELAESGMAILLISSEIEELMGLSDRILVIHRGRLQGQFRRPEFDRERILKAAFGQGVPA